MIVGHRHHPKKTGPRANNAGVSIASGISVNADSIFENDETLQLTLSVPVSATLGTHTTHTHTILNDETNEQFLVNLSALLNATLGDLQGVGTITNDDASRSLSVNDVSISEGNAGPQVLSFTVTRTGSTAFVAGFSFSSADNTTTIADNGG